MPELPEVEAVRRLLERVVAGRRIVQANAADDPIVFKGSSEPVVAALLGARVKAVGRKGKVFWLELEDGPAVMGHLGMSGWIREVSGTGPEKRLVSHGNAPLDDPEGQPRFLKLRLATDEQRTVAFTDARRLGRVWLASSAAEDPMLRALGPDAWLEPYNPPRLAKALAGRTAPIKSLLLDQRLFAGVGNWVADEVLYQARIAPARPAGTLNAKERGALVRALKTVLDLAVEVEADADRYPEGWLFHHRWGGRRGKDEIEGRPIRRETIGGRTAAWVPSLQR
ncbi:MAG: hypothetical protein KIT11_01315 [Fimbriimonadaceae bacterium]|nr:hypothetical protein [Fimbriimonadaceae bacterium]QYK54988.1 MAG: hypothetical protein KF733_08220 [Fimbriimonadaceae bacterium]